MARLGVGTTHLVRGLATNGADAPGTFAAILLFSFLLQLAAQYSAVQALLYVVKSARQRIVELPQTVPEMTCADVPVVATRALKEAHGELHGGFGQSPIKHALDLGYPVPKHLTQAGCEAIVAQFLPKAERERWVGGGGRLPPSKL